MFPTSAAAIVGIGETPLGRLLRSPIELYVDACRAAVDDAGVEFGEIDGLISTGLLAVDDERDLHRHHIRLAEQLGLRQLRLMETSKLGGAAIGESLRLAALYMDAGLVDTVLIAGADSYRSRLSREQAQQLFMLLHDRELEGPFGHTAPVHWAMSTQKYMEKFGLAEEDLAHVVVSARKWAVLNPSARVDQELTVEEVLASPVVAAPLHVYDCSRVIDGGGAIVVRSAKRLRATRRQPIYVRGVGAAYSQYYMPDYPSFPDSVFDLQKASCDMAYAAAGVKPSDIDVAFPYDGFSSMVWMHLDAMGFFPRGHVAKLICEGYCAPGGPLPINTHGGSLNHGLPAFPAKFFFINEAVRQLRGDCGDRQVHGAELAMFHGVSGVGGINASVVLST